MRFFPGFLQVPAVVCRPDRVIVRPMQWHALDSRASRRRQVPYHGERGRGKRSRSHLQRHHRLPRQDCSDRRGTRFMEGLLAVLGAPRPMAGLGLCVDSCKDVDCHGVFLG